MGLLSGLLNRAAGTSRRGATGGATVGRGVGTTGTARGAGVGGMLSRLLRGSRRF
ncbi:hypothetical protein [Ornithinimicrobium pekingense]|uniref:Uncharacterized protein n=1 Tax=Ornithinimicrobium pekingense TaxID=384677 RepID=A0ABQ2FDZ1_9MICO|nr:hypothetical protein [Ornithinimicrobium pekingense]GGK80087.1 hypothetical protein GCM10011509_30720 [Ornithinimicrobium pekingense]